MYLSQLLSLCARENKLEWVKFLVENNNIYLQTPFRIACLYQHEKIVSYFLNKGVEMFSSSNTEKF